MLARDRYIISGDTENAVAYMGSFAHDTPARFCSTLQNGIRHDCSYSAAALIEKDAVFAVELYLEAKKSIVIGGRKERGLTSDDDLLPKYHYCSNSVVVFLKKILQRFIFLKLW